MLPLHDQSGADSRPIYLYVASHPHHSHIKSPMNPLSTNHQPSKQASLASYLIPMYPLFPPCSIHHSSSTQRLCISATLTHLHTQTRTRTHTHTFTPIVSPGLRRRFIRILVVADTTSGTSVTSLSCEHNILSSPFVLQL
jgi:hypothetical protein